MSGQLSTGSICASSTSSSCLTLYSLNMLHAVQAVDVDGSPALRTHQQGCTRI